MTWLAGATPFETGEDGTSVKINLTGDDKVQSFIDFWQKLIDEDLIDTKTAGWTDEWNRGLNDGSIASLLTGAWMPYNLLSGAPDGDGKWRIAQMPTLDGSETNSENGGSSLAVIKTDDEAKAEALAAAETARNLPKIEGGTWRVYDTESKQYLDSGVGATGRSPKIEGGTWWTWDDAAGQYQDTGVSVSSQYVLTKEAVEQVLTGDIASHSHDAQMAEKLAPYAKTQDVDEKIAAAAPTKEKIEAALTGDITSHNHNTQITQALQPYAKSTDVTAQLAAALEQYVTNAALSAALEAYKLTKAKIEEALTGDITSHNHTTQVTQALAPYAKTKDVDSKLTAYAKTADVNTKVAAAEAKIPTKLSQLQNDNHTVQDAAYVHTDQNFTAALKQKLDGLANYNDSALRSLISAAQAKADQAQANLDKLVSGDASAAIDTFNEIEAFLKGVTDTETLTGLLAQQKSEITADAAAKYQPKGSYAAASHNHDDRYPTKTGSGASGTWPVSVSGSAVKLASRGNLTALTGKNSGENGFNMYQAYNNGYPVSYGNLLHVFTQGSSELLMGWSGKSGAVEHLYYRNRRDITDANWSAWVTVLDSTNFSQYALPKNGKAADADKLGGKAASEYALKSEVPDTSHMCTVKISINDIYVYRDGEGVTTDGQSGFIDSYWNSYNDMIFEDDEYLTLEYGGLYLIATPEIHSWAVQVPKNSVMYYIPNSYFYQSYYYNFDLRDRNTYKITEDCEIKLQFCVEYRR